MKNKEMLRKIYYENKAINRNMQRLVNIGLIGILGGIAKEAKASDDPKAKILVKAGMVMIAITEGLLLFSDILVQKFLNKWTIFLFCSILFSSNQKEH